ncbi:GAF domain-containing protein [Nocardioides sp. zg-1230]|uniref:GAF domain-containing protein n=1 Tax=Nocardioides sp. zg-1230 TaxID=2736601 RepID=UPI00155456C8|nr:GAF domain-containing protein [Nocardioides sp. zg-1230]NPC41133.1 GAF domain-containing protein [Nocardioides sp. zg-1230]
MPEPEKQDRAWLWLVITVVCVVGSPGAAYASQKVDGKGVWLLVGLQFVLTAFAFLIPQVRQLRAKEAETTAEVRELEARADTRAAVNDALDPILRQLGDISAERSKPVRDRLIAQAIPFVLTAASNLIGSDRSRACWFELTDDVPPRLVPRLDAGRSGSASTIFEPNTPSGDAAIGMVLAGENLLCRDIDTEPPPGWDSSKKRDYKTFISVSVTAADTAFGMLTLDALEAGDLTNDDLRMLGLMASALAAALAQGR